MSTKETRVVIKRAIYLGMDNYELIADELLGEDAVNHGPGEDDFGREAYNYRRLLAKTGSWPGSSKKIFPAWSTTIPPIPLPLPQ